MNEELLDGGAPLEPQPHPAQSRNESTTRPLPDDALIILPVRNMVLFPGIVVPLAVGRERSRAAAQEAVRLQRPIGILLQTKPDIEQPTGDEMHWVGTTAQVLRYVTGAEGTHHVICKG
ncbi:MAG: LON peptidase substrate-binding domain-containing protein, partial [Bacillota bacterium]